MDRDAVRKALNGDPHDYEAILAAMSAVYSAVYEEFNWLPHGGTAVELIVAIRIAQYRENVVQTTKDRERWDCEFAFVMDRAIDVVRELDEARQQLAEAREQLHKIGRKAFWAGRGDTPK